MTKKENEIKIAEYGDWCSCPKNPSILRRLVGFDSKGLPIIEEKKVTEFSKCEVSKKRC